MTDSLLIQFKYDFGEGKMTSSVFLFSLNMISTKGKLLRKSFFFQFKCDFGEGNMTSTVFLFSLNMISTKGK